MRNVVAPPVQFIAVAARLENTDTSKVAPPPPPPPTKTDRLSHRAPDGAKNREGRNIKNNHVVGRLSKVEYPLYRFV